MAGERNFSLLYNIPTSSGTYSASYCMRTRIFFSKGKATTCKVDHSPPSSAQVKSA